MKKPISIFFIVLLSSVAFVCCNKDEVYLELNTSGDLTFNGNFKTINSEELEGSVFLNLNNGSYECSTDLPFGNGAGKVVANGRTIEFIDTLFVAIPAIYGPSYVLSGKHYYKFDGKNLSIWKDKNVGKIKYDLVLVE
jgi:hypothetical protein